MQNPKNTKGLKINYAQLTVNEQKLVKKISNDGDVTLGDVINFTPKSAGITNGLPDRHLRDQLLAKIDAVIDSGIDLMESKLFRLDVRLCREELDKLLLSDLSTYLKGLGSTERIVVTKRYGIGCHVETLEEIAKPLGLTRERVRQIEAATMKHIHCSVRVSPDSLSESLHNLRNCGELLAALPDTKSVFSDELKYISFLEIASNSKRGTFSLNTKLNPKELFDWFKVNKAPLNVETALSVMSNNPAEAHNAIRKGVLDGILRIECGNIIPVGLTSYIAFAQAALCIGSPASPKEIFDYAVEQGFLTDRAAKAKTFNRVIQTGVKEGLIYGQQGGLYLHASYFKFESCEIKNILQKIRDVLQKNKEPESLMLKSCILDAGLGNYDYFDIRHMVNRYGENEGIHFNGQSQSDVLSLSNTPDRNKQSSAILHWLRANPEKAVSKEEIMSRIRTSTKGNVNRIIRELVTDGLIVDDGGLFRAVSKN